MGISISSSMTAISSEARTAGVEENQLKSTGTVGRFQQRLQILGQIQLAKELGWIPVEEPDAMEMYQLGNLMMWRCCVCFAMLESSESYSSKDSDMLRSYKTFTLELLRDHFRAWKGHCFFHCFYFPMTIRQERVRCFPQSFIWWWSHLVLVHLLDMNRCMNVYDI